MKITRDIRNQAKSLFRVCFEGGYLSEERVRRVSRAIAEKKPRNAVGILSWFKKLVELEIKKRTVQVETAVTLADEGKSVFEEAEKHFGPALAKQYQTNQTLLGGMKIRIGSHVWDGSIRHRLNTINPDKNL